MKLIVLAVTIPTLLFCDVKSQIRERLEDCERVIIDCKVSNWSHDVCVYYYVLGLRDAYKDTLELIKEDK